MFRPFRLHLPRRFRGLIVLVQPEDQRPFFQKRARMSAAPERPVYPSLSRLHLCRRQHFRQENGDMPAPRRPIAFRISHAL